MHRIYKPIIGAINGWALAGGLETALACDIRIASDRAMFGSFEARRGFHHGDGGIVRLVNTCGTGIALEMLLTAEPIDAQRALQCNLVSKVVPHERLMEEAETVAAADPAELPARRPLGQADDPRHGRQDARRAAPQRGLERLQLRGPEETTGAPRPLLREDRRGARRHPRDRAVRRALGHGRSSPGRARDRRRDRRAPAADGLEVTTLDRDEGCDLQVDLARGRAPGPRLRRRLRLQRGDHRHDRPGPPHDRRSSGAATST